MRDGPESGTRSDPGTHMGHVGSCQRLNESSRNPAGLGGSAERCEHRLRGGGQAGETGEGRRSGG